MQQRIYTLTGRTGQRLTVLKVDASNGNISGAKVDAASLRWLVEQRVQGSHSFIDVKRFYAQELTV